MTIERRASQDQPATLTALLRQRAEERPDQRAFTFLVDGEREEVAITYAELDRQARAIAAWLQAIGVAGDRALLLYPSGLEFIAALFGCFYAGVVAVPTYPGRMERSNRRLQAIVRDAQPTVVLTGSAGQIEIEQQLTPGVDHLEWLATDHLTASLADEWSEAAPAPDQLALLQYTSGSTAMPKGVMLTHANLLANLAAMESGFHFSAQQSGVSWLPLYHDMGLIGSILLPIYSNSHNTLLSPLAFLSNPLRWLQAISRTGATISGGPNFAYDLCVERISAEEAATLNLSQWTLALNGAEPVRAQTMERFSTTFAPSGFRRDAFYPVYGLAEATLFVSGRAQGGPTNWGTEPTRPRPVSCGPGWPGQRLRIVDPALHTRCADGQVGEIWLAGPHVAQGYWQRPEETHSAFHARLADGSEGPFLRTGDLGLLHDGELYITGRDKDLIIIRGQNHYPQEIELTVEASHPALRANHSAAFSVRSEPAGEEAGAEQLVVVTELRPDQRTAAIDPIVVAIRSAVMLAHELELYAIVLIEPDSLPKTTSGKVQRQRCRELFLANQLAVIGQRVRQVSGGTINLTPSPAPDSSGEMGFPLSTVERGPEGEVNRTDLNAVTAPATDEPLPPLAVAVRAKLAELLNVPPEQLDFSQPIHTLGIGSLAAAALKHYVESTYGLELPVALFFEELSVDELLARLTAGLPQGPLSEPVSQLQPEATPAPIAAARVADVPVDQAAAMQFSLLFFSANEAEFTQHKYRLLLEAAHFADAHDFTAIWLPERHFHAFGGLYPDPAVLAAGLATTTQQIRLRAGSVVLPLNNPVRVAEQWAVVDNLSGGRVDLSFATGWNPTDFVLAPEAFADRVERTYAGMATVQRLWQGESIELPNGVGEVSSVRIYPLPQQRTLNLWMTCSGGAERFQEAGAKGLNVLTALLFQSVAELATKLALYRQARADHGHDPAGGQVTLMLHTYLGETLDEVRETVRTPFKQYLATSAHLWQQAAQPLPLLTDQEKEDALEYAFERYFQTSTLMGTVQQSAALVADLQAIGVNEIACLIDFGVAPAQVMRSLELLALLQKSYYTVR